MENGNNKNMDHQQPDLAALRQAAEEAAERARQSISDASAYAATVSQPAATSSATAAEAQNPGLSAQTPSVRPLMPPAPPLPPVAPPEQAEAAPQPQPQPNNKKEKKGPSAGALVVVVILSLLLGAGAGFGGGYYVAQEAATRIMAKVEENVAKYMDDAGATVLYRSVSTSSADSPRPVMDTNAVVNVCADSVVEILTEVVTDYGFFGKALSEGAGSGVIISEDGYIVTCAHVISGATTINISLRNGETYEAKVIGTYEDNDIAVIKIEAEGLTPAVFGDSSAMVVGDPVVAIGNPLGQLGGTVTQGIISALAREVTVEGQTFSLLQTDAAINGGNSGGGLFNAAGELVGFVSAYASDAEGLNFAIPVNDVQSFIEELISYGYIASRVALGVNMININDQRTAMNYGVNELGVYIYQVVDGSNAEYAGLRTGDRFVTIDGEEITTSDQVAAIISSHVAGDVLSVVISRNGTQQTVEITLYGVVPSMETAAPASITIK